MAESIIEYCLTHIEIVIIAALSLIQIAPIKINPWSALGRFIVNQVNGEVANELKIIREDVEEMKRQLDDVSAEADKSNARQSRVRILRFDDELLHGQKHTKDHFRQVLDDIDVYEDYCERHPDFRNGVAKHAMQHIKSVFDDLEKKGGFLE